MHYFRCLYHSTSYCSWHNLLSFCNVMKTINDLFTVPITKLKKKCEFWVHAKSVKGRSLKFCQFHPHHLSLYHELQILRACKLDILGKYIWIREIEKGSCGAPCNVFKTKDVAWYNNYFHSWSSLELDQLEVLSTFCSYEIKLRPSGLTPCIFDAHK